MECFTVMSDKIEGRIDPSPYHPIRLSTIERIKKSKFELLTLTEVVEFSKKLVTSKDSNLKYIGLKNIEPNSGFFISSEEEKEIFGTALKFEKGDILFPKLRPYLNKVYLAEFDGVCSTEFHVLKAKKCNKMYLFCFLNSQLVVNQTSYLMTGNTLPRLQKTEVENLLILLPSLSIQNKIVSLMDSAYSSKKSNGSEAVKLSDSINDYVLDKLGIELPELKEDMAYVVNSNKVKNNRCDAYYFQSKFEEVEKAVNEGKFEVKELREIIDKLLSGQRPKGGVRQIEDGIPSLGGEHVLSDGNVKTYDLKFIPEEFHKTQLKSKVMKKDILIVKDGATTGKVGIIPEEYPFEEANINEHVFLLRIKTDINPYFIFSFLKSKAGQIQINRDITGGTITGIIRETTEKIKIPLPPLSVQNKIADEVKKRMQRAEQLQKEANEELEKAKRDVEKIILN